MMQQPEPDSRVLPPTDGHHFSDNFEDGDVGAVPRNWSVPEPGYEAGILAEGGQEASRCVRLRRNGSEPVGRFGNLRQSFDAKPWRGKPIRLRFWVRVEGSRTSAQMYLGVDREGGQRGIFDTSDAWPDRTTHWSECEITGIVDPDAEVINIGVFLLGEGELWIDRVELAATGEALDFGSAEPPRALTDNGLTNLLAYAELFGMVRHFHPSDEAAAVDWGAIAVQGVREIEGVSSPETLAEVLQAHFAGLAPTVRVFPKGQPPKPMAMQEQKTITYWKHVSYGRPNSDVYTSQRLRVESAADLPPAVPDPVHPYAAELTGGVACLVPLSLYTDEDGTLPRPTMTPPAESRPHGPSGDDRATRLADVVIAWNILQHFYPYFDVTPVDWKQELTRALRSAATDADARTFCDTLNRLVAALKDGHAYAGHPSMLTGMGALPLEWDWIEGRLVVTAVTPDLAPSLAPGDVVLAIDGVPVEEAHERVERLISGATPQWIRHTALCWLRMRDVKESCTLELAGYPDDAPKCVNVSPGSQFDSSSLRPPKMAELEPGVWYIDLSRVTDAEHDGLVEALTNADGIIYDMRRYPRKISSSTLFAHLIDKPVTSAQWHLPIIYRPNREQLTFERKGEWNLVPQAPYFQARKAFLTGGGAISAAESFMGIVEHYKLADIVGGPTAGTNGNVNPVKLPGGYLFRWTGMKVLKHDGSRHHGVGIQPTIPIQRTRRGAAEGRDEILQAALARVRCESPGP